MGKVVELDPESAKRVEGRRRGGPASAAKRTQGRRRGPPARTALVLGGGGFTGAVYQIGALGALDVLSVDHTVGDFDVYVGTSAGAFVAALLANGVTPEEMMRAVGRRPPPPLRDLNVATLLRPDLREYLRAGARLPLRLASLARLLITRLSDTSAVDILLGLSGALPAGLYSGTGTERYIRAVLSEPGRSNDFRRLARQLYLVATDLDSCERVVLGSPGWDDVPISLAVQASTALPMIYRPVAVRGRELVDGGLVSTTNLDIAVQAGAKLVIVVNPLVPYVSGRDGGGRGSDGPRDREPGRPRGRRVSDMGFAHVGYQAFKLLTHQRLHQLAGEWQARYPGVDIVLIEPDADDELMFQTNMLSFASRAEIARHGFRSVMLKLAEDHQRYGEICARHGIEIAATPARVAQAEASFGWPSGAS